MRRQHPAVPVAIFCRLLLLAAATLSVALPCAAQVPTPAAPADLARHRLSAETELRRLESERETACRQAASVECKRKVDALSTARPGLQARIESLKKQELQVRVPGPQPQQAVVPVRPPLVVVPPRPGPVIPPIRPGCGTCQTGPGNLQAKDPLPPVGNTAGTNISTSPSDLPSTRRTVSATGCFIATAAYGSPDAPVVLRLRTFRDEHLLGHPLGEAFVRSYYQVSPPIAEAIATRPWARQAVRMGLRVLVGVMDAPELVLLGAVLVVLVARRWRRGARLQPA
jgi:hypothetical protein